MPSQRSPNFACGQILYSLKMSNLNYLLKETPFSAYITIRKKFIRDTSIEKLDKLGNDSSPSDLEVEVIALRESKKDLETRIEIAKVDFEERELEKESILAKLDKQDEEIEHYLKNERMFSEEIKVLTIEKEGLKTTIDEISNEKSKHLEKLKEKECQKSSLEKELGKTKRKFNDLEIVNTELEENILMFENKLATKDQKVYDLKEELRALEDATPIAFSALCDKCEYVANPEKSFIVDDKTEHSDENLPSTSSCGKCDYTSDDEEVLNQHIQSVHVILCDLCDFETDSNAKLDEHKLSVHTFPCKNCNLNFKSERKLSEHMCRIHILNPVCGDLYMKNYIIFEECTRIFSTRLEREIVYLHSNQCINIKWCPDMLPYWESDTVNYDGNMDIWHAPLNEFFSEGQIIWKKLRSHFGINKEEFRDK